MNNNRILVVDDEPDLCEILQFNLENEGYIVDVANSAEEALTKDIAIYDLLLLDVMMGDISGFRLARMLQEKPNINVPIIFISARDTENDMLTGFNLGADDYITKPFSIKQVIARVKVVTRRALTSSAADIEKPLVYEDLQLFREGKKVLLNNEEIAFTKKEFEIFKLLLENRNRVFSREEILSYVWSDEVVVLDRTVDVNITRLRKKIGVYGKNIVTRLGYGYTFQE